MKANMNRFLNRMGIINKIGYEENEGITRLALSNEDMQAREMIKEICKSLDLKIREDGFGNILARKMGKNDDLPAVLVGSHIDTVPNGGKYDGLLGVIAAIETIHMMIENKIEHDHPIELVVFSTEESSRFNIATVGSKGITGNLNSAPLKEYVDKDGVSLYDALVDRGFCPEDMKKLNAKDVKGFVELHIEQGPILENEGLDIGVVEAIAAPMRLRINLLGEEAHSGSCPMEMRKDALTSAAEIILEVEKIGRKESKNKTVATTGNCIVSPGAMNVVPGEVNLLIDIRGIYIESVLRALNDVISKTSQICKDRKIEYQIKVLSQDRPVSLDKDLCELVKENCRKLGLKFKQMASGAGHDAMNMAKIVPSALIFIPCIGGISHNKREDVKDSDMENGIKVLFETIVSLAK